MFRVDDDTLSLHLEVGLATAPPSLLNDLADGDWRRRQAAADEIARQLVERLRCFDIRTDQGETRLSHQAMLFPPDMEPLG
ncbi:hypothetical protein [Sphingopyxis sp. PET50]|uniref:hypothetical protein n=1 Tax=Sphingopyxis sp. PET50 TaxID=2976533 RepID=UPI0021B046E2|nr:hypothetical protein [Sphingopyxis sp. PET50]